LNSKILDDLDKIIQMDESVTYDYSCSMFVVDGKIRRKIQDFISVNIDDDDVYWGDENYDDDAGIQLDSHVTICYGYNTDDHLEIFKSFEGYQKDSVSIVLGQTKHFSSDTNNILYIEVKSKDLQELNSLSLKSGLKITTIYPTYKPHITLAYIKKNVDVSNYYTDYFENEKFEGRKIMITTSDGKKKFYDIKNL
jgi:hypothetical protein